MLINPYSFNGSAGEFAATSYTGNGTTQSIVTGQNLANGGMALLREAGIGDNFLYDTERGATFQMATSGTAGSVAVAGAVTAFNSNGFSVGNDGDTNASFSQYHAFSWLESAGFLDIVTYSGTGENQTISHDLNATPRMIWAKCTSTGDVWSIYHDSLTSSEYMLLNSTQAAATLSAVWNSTAPILDEFYVGTASQVNSSGRGYIAYLFGGVAGRSAFGSYTGNTTSGVTITCGFEPKAWMQRCSAATGDWHFCWVDGATIWSILLNSSTAPNDVTARYTITPSGIIMDATATSVNQNNQKHIHAFWG